MDSDDEEAVSAEQDFQNEVDQILHKVMNGR